MNVTVRPVRAAISAAIAILALAGCGSSSTAPTPNLAVLTARAPAVGGRDAFVTLLEQSRNLGPAQPGRQVSFILTLRDPNAARGGSGLASLYNPRSPNYGRYESARQYAATHGPRPDAVRSVTQWLVQHGLKGSWRRGDDWMLGTGTVRRVDRALRLAIDTYLSPRGVRFIASARDPSIPSELRSAVMGAGHISTYFQPQRYAIPVGGLSPTQLTQAYDIGPLRSLGLTGAGQTIVFFELDGYHQADLDKFTSMYGLPSIHPIIRGGKALSNVEGEAEMDLEVAHEIAPDAKLVLYNIDWPAVTNASSSFADLGNRTVPLQDQMITQNAGAVISESWGICETLFGSQVSSVYENLYAKADSLGETAFVSTGDSGAFTCLEAAKAGTPPSPDYLSTSLPATSSGVTAVGGTRLSVRQNGSWFDETVWEDPPLAEGGGGGVSAYVARPAWQSAPGVVNPQFDPSSTREIPDVSADADPDSGTANVISGQLSQGGGTSQAAPIMAGIATLINQYLARQHLHRLGFLNPALYALASGHPRYPPFHDVTVGSNLYYPAGPGYDLASGLGSVDAWNLARDLAAYQRSGKP